MEIIYIYPEKIPVCRLCMDSFLLFDKKKPCSECTTDITYYRMKLTHVNSLVSLKLFYDIGRLPLHLGGDYGRVMWTALAGSKWINFKTWMDFRWYVLDRDNGKCKHCGKTITTKNEKGLWLSSNADFVCDHIIPLCKDGKDWWEDPGMLNFQTLCVDCNKLKTKNDMATLVIDRKLTKVIGKQGMLLSEFASL